MKQFFGILTILWACAYLAPLQAQNSPCNAGFDYQINGKTVSFKTGNPTTHPQRHFWTFGDGGTSDGQNPTHTYNSPGQYRVMHYVKDSLENCHDSVIKIITIQGTTCNITASFTFTRSNDNCRKIKFTNTSIVPSSNVHFVWKFGDGTSSTEPNPTHVYEKDGNYKVCLVIETNNGCRVEACKEIEIRCSTPPPPVCNVKSKFEWKRDATLWNKIWFNNISQPVSSIWRTYWTYGDGTSSQDFNSMHIYQKPGKYYVCLKVQSLLGCIVAYCDSVIVKDPNVPGIVNVSPNPVTSVARIEFEMETADKVYIRILDMSGSPKIELNTWGQAGNNYINIPVDKLSSGFYIVEIRYGNQTKLGKFQKG